MKKIRYQNLIKAVLFTVLTVVMLGGILKITNYKTTGGGGGWQHLYDMDKNSIDVIAFGSSHAHCTVNHGYLWDEHGIAGYTMSAGSQQMDSTYYFVKEALKTQKPKAVLVEVWGAARSEINNQDEDVYRNSLSMKWSLDFANYINYLADDMEMDRSRKQEILTKLPVVHSRYQELEKEDFVDDMPYMVGYRGSFEVESFEMPGGAAVTETEALSEEMLQILQNIVTEAEANGVDVIFWAAPYVVSETEQKRFNAVEEFANASGVQFINYNKLYDEIGIDFARDFRDGGHVNNYGAAKVTEHLAQVLKQNYEMVDRRGDESYRLWEENARYLRNKELRHTLQNAEDINAYLQILSELEEDKTVVLSLNGNYNALGEVYLEKLMQLGVTAEEYAAGGAFVWKGGERILYLPGKEYADCYATGSGEIHLESSCYTTEEGEEKQKVMMLLDGTDYYMAENGVNMIVYDESINQIVDVAADDVYMGLALTHYEGLED